MRSLLALAAVCGLAVGCDDKADDTGAEADADTDSDTDSDTDTDTDSDTDTDYEELVPAEGVATDITVDIYSDGWGNLLETRTLETEGSITCDTVEDEPYSDPAAFYLYAYADGFWTELYTCTFGGEVAVDLDAVPEVEGAVAGSVFEMQYYFADWEFAGRELTLDLPDGTSTTTTTDSQGRFGLGGLPAGDVGVALESEGESFTFTVPNAAEGTDYQDLFFYSPIQAGAPILCLLPEVTTEVDVVVDFPSGGHVTVSDPPYDDGWHVTVEPGGLIDGAWPYLFYEGNIPLVFQDDAGWVVDGSDTEAGLRAILSELGFEGREIDDFVAWWLPTFDDAPWLAVYPQDPEQYTTLDIDPAPDAMLRAMLMVRELYYPMTLPAPELAPPPERDGFVAVEWGVLLGL